MSGYMNDRCGRIAMKLCILRGLKYYFNFKDNVYKSSDGSKDG